MAAQYFNSYPHALDLNDLALKYEHNRADLGEFYTESSRLLAEAAKNGTRLEVEPPVEHGPREAWAAAGAGATVMRVRGSL